MTYAVPLWLIFASLLLILAVLIASYWKVRRIHIATYKIGADAEAARREAESLFRQLQAFLSLERLLGLRRPLPALRGWAGSPDFLLVIAEAVSTRKPMTVVECGSGASTLVVARCLEFNASGHVYSLEHSPDHAERTRQLLATHGLSEWATVVTAPLELDPSTRTPWYCEQALPRNLPPIDMLIVDGPPASVGRLARAPAFERLRDRMSSRILIVIDDADRPDEMEMIERWHAAEPRLRETREPAEKGLSLLVRDDAS